MYSKNPGSHSRAVQRTSDIPVEHKDVEAASVKGHSLDPTRSSDKPVTKLGQGLHGNRHEIASTGATGGSASQGHGR